MVRTQIQLTPEQAAALKALSQARQTSMADLIRKSIDIYLQREAVTTRGDIVARAKAAAGRFASGASDGSANHDRYLTDAFGGK